VSVEAEAERIAQNIPLCHFPASQKLAEWISWGQLVPNARRSPRPAEPDNPFVAFRDGHVFFYAGPCCFVRPDAAGDAAAYFRPAPEVEALVGATPFDSGSLEPDDARLQPWAARPVAERWDFLMSQRVTAGWRAGMQAWLQACYDTPRRYLESSADPYAAGLPDRTDPPELRTHNGKLGAADRRAWTWEVQCPAPVTFDAIAVLHVPADRVQDALRLRGQRTFQVVGAAVDSAVGAAVLYEASGELLAELIGLTP
jgi:hypothetical protein